MERLTFDGNFCDIAQCRELPCPYDNNCMQKQVWERLRAYEDTRSSPGEVISMKMDMAILRAMFHDAEVDRMKELAEADKAGRVVVLPCKIGDTVYVNSEKRTTQVSVDEAYLDDDNNNKFKYLVSFDCDYDCDGCPFSSWQQDYEGESYCDGEGELASIRSTDFGKTVFLTREDAEKALEARKDG